MARPLGVWGSLEALSQPRKRLLTASFSTRKMSRSPMLLSRSVGTRSISWLWVQQIRCVPVLRPRRAILLMLVSIALARSRLSRSVLRFESCAISSMIKMLREKLVVCWFRASSMLSMSISDCSSRSSWASTLWLVLAMRCSCCCQKSSSSAPNSS